MGEVRWEKIHVLVVDDDAIFLRIMEEYLKVLGCPAVCCRNGKEAVEQIKQHHYDICFMDIMMPEMNGIEAVQIIRDDLQKTLPILAVTSSNMKADKEKCEDVGMNDYIVKPVSLEVIKASLVNYVINRPPDKKV